ncbi:MAG: hypothetical protein HY606_00310 [Planctomycetes bacterium]|nr:hypothetical protein [Planctomycetota bacterium]
MEKDITKSFRFTSDVWQQVELKSKQLSLSTSDFVRCAVENALPEQTPNVYFNPQNWEGLRFFAKREGYDSVELFVMFLLEAFLSKTFAQKLPDLSQVNTELKTTLVQLFNQQQTQRMRKMELSATVETFVLLRLMAEKMDASLAEQAHALAAQHLAEAGRGVVASQESMKP